MALFKRYEICFGDVVQEVLPVDNPFVTFYFNFLNVPAFVTLASGSAPNTYTGWQINGKTTSGTYSFSFQENTLTGNRNWTVIIEVGACGTVVYDNCCTNQYNIAWLNRQGGWQNYIFTGIKTFEVRQDDGDTFKTYEKVIKWANKKEVYNGVILTTGNTPKSHVDYLDSLRYSIQAYLYNDLTDAWDIEILIDSDSFVKYTSRQKLFDNTISFIYANELVIQSQ
jgi:hypothetical protein